MHVLVKRPRKSWSQARVLLGDRMYELPHNVLDDITEWVPLRPLTVTPGGRCILARSTGIRPEFTSMPLENSDIHLRQKISTEPESTTVI